MIPITVPLIGGTITSVIYVLLVTPIVFEMTKQHELRTKGKIDLIDATHNYYIIISCLLLNVTAAVAQTLSLDAILTNVRTNNPPKCTMPTYRYGCSSQRSTQLDGTSSEYRLVYDPYNINPDRSYMIGVTQMIPNASRLKADSDYMNASVEVENKNYTVNQLNALVKRIITNGLYLIKKKSSYG
jgi:hypothetical protein